MLTRLATWFTLLLCTLALAAAAVADEDKPNAATLHARGRAQLAAARFEDALVSLKAAARLAPDRKDYAQDALILRRVVLMRKQVALPQPGPKWEKLAVSLHAFYLRHHLPAEAVALGRRGIELRKDTAAEARLAEALLDAGQHAEVLELLDARVTWARDERQSIFRGIALARGRQFDDALKVAKSLKLGAGVSPLRLRDAARLEGLLGREDACASLLVRCFEATPPANLAALKAQVRAHPDFRRVAAGPKFEKAMTTSSKVKAASCSGGTDCGSCPKRGGCGGKK